MSAPLLHQRSHSMPVGNEYLNTAAIKDPPSFERLLQLRETSSFMTDGFFDSSNNVHDVYEVNNSDYNKTPCVITLNCKMDRGFFFTSDCHWTCYRRNYFQVSATFSITGYNDSTFALQINSTLVPIEQFYIRLKACISDNHDKPITLTQMTPKRDKGPQREPPMVPVSVDNNTVTFERLQFKVATANNGKKRAAQQYFRLAFELVAQSKEEYYVISECYSQPLVVRGRSPGHYNADPLEPRRRRKLSEPQYVFMPPPPLSSFHPVTQYFHARSQSVNDSYQRHQQSKVLELLDDDVGISTAIRNWREQRQSSDDYAAYISSHGYSSPFAPSSSISQSWPDASSFRQKESEQEY